MLTICGKRKPSQMSLHTTLLAQDERCDEVNSCSLLRTSTRNQNRKPPTNKCYRLCHTATAAIRTDFRRPSTVSTTTTLHTKFQLPTTLSISDKDSHKQKVTSSKVKELSSKTANWASSLDFINIKRVRTAPPKVSRTGISRLERDRPDVNQPKLLYLRDDGHCSWRPMSVNDEQHQNSTKRSSGSTRVDDSEPDIKDRLSRNCCSTYNQLLTYRLANYSQPPRNISSEQRKQRYIDEVIDKHMWRNSGNANYHQCRRSKVKSAPVCRSKTLDTTSDNLIGMFEWGNMSRLRRRMGEEDTEAAKQEETVFRDKVRLKKNRAKRCLLVITRIFLAIQFWSKEKTTRSAAELQWFTLNTSTEAKTLAFNKELFTQARAQAKVPGWAIHIMEKLPPKRTEKECRKLHALMRGLKSFDKFTERIQLAMCKSIRYENIESMRIVLRKGHIGLNFYFLYSGSVFINVEDIGAKGEVFVKTEVILSRGDSFGEIALLQEVARTATVSARETCELFTVDREVFSTLCPQIFDKELAEKIAFLQSVPLFQSRWWTDEAKRNLCFQAHILQYKTNRVVVEDSTTVDWMYICMTGKCKIIRHLQFEGASTELMDSWMSEDEEELDTEISNLLTPGTENGRFHFAGRKASYSERRRRKSSQKDKGRLLQSMGLTYVDSNQKITENRSATDDGTHTKEFALTLTSLINQISKDTGQINSVFLDIGTLDTGDVFDLESILNRKLTQTDSKMILVSGGASLLRLKRNQFFQYANDDCLQHAQTIATKHRHPSERMLLRSYKEKENWDHYKDRVVREVVGQDMKWTGNCQALSELKQMELEHRTKRLLAAYSKKSDRKLSSTDRQGRKVIGMDTLGAFILGGLKWRTQSTEKPQCDEGDSADIIDSDANKGSNSDSAGSSPRIPTIVIN